jgi:hypothetical protein
VVWRALVVVVLGQHLGNEHFATLILYVHRLTGLHFWFLPSFGLHDHANCKP